MTLYYSVLKWSKTICGQVIRQTEAALITEFSDCSWNIKNDDENELMGQFISKIEATM